MNYRKYGFNLSRKDKLIKYISLSVIVILQILLTLFVYKEKIEQIYIYIVTSILITLFLITFFYEDFLLLRHNKKILNQLKEKLRKTEGNHYIPKGYTYDYVVAKDDQNNIKVLLFIYDMNRNIKDYFIYSDNYLLPAVNRFNEVLVKKENNLNISNYLINLSKDPIFKKIYPDNLSFQSQSKRFYSIKSNLFVSILSSVFLKLVTFCILLSFMYIIFEINAIYISSIAMFSFDKVANWFMQSGNVNIHYNGIIKSKLTAITINNTRYVINTKNSKFLYAYFSECERKG